MVDKKELLKKYLKGNISKEELAFLLEILGNADNAEKWQSEWEHVLEEDSDFVQSQPESEDKSVTQEQISLYNRISYSIHNTRLDEEHPNSIMKFVKRSKWFWSAAAVIAVILSIATYWYNMRYTDTKIVSGQHMSDADDKTNRTILKRADGSEVVLDGAQGGVQISNDYITYDNGQKLLDFKASENEQLTIQTPCGATFSVRLSDGTQVWLNASSSLHYSTNLINAEGEREVRLEGEAYFEVAKDDKLPFVVKSELQDIRVLGTHFNVNAYAEENEVKTTLLEGRVEVSTKGNTTNSVELNPNQQAVLTNNKLKILDVDPQVAMDWKNGLFYFDREKLPVIMRKLARWYNVDITYSVDYSKDDFSGIISREKTLEEVLDMLELTGLVHFKTEGRRVVVMP